MLKLQRGSLLSFRILLLVVAALGTSCAHYRPGDKIASFDGETIAFYNPRKAGESDALRSAHDRVLRKAEAVFATENHVVANADERDAVVNRMELPVPRHAISVFTLVGMADDMVVNWKVRQQLYERYGGTIVVMRRYGYFPVDAYLAYFKTLEGRGRLVFLDQRYRSDFYEHFASLKERSQRAGEGRYFSRPPWQSD